ncbi:MAG: hypothetical protein Q8R17_03060 [bacterium]|nr:hypothetical protein [bacterium]
MPKQVVSDVTPPGARRSVRSIPVPARSYRYRSTQDESGEEDVIENEAPIRIAPPRGGGNRALLLLWGVVAAALVGLALAVGIAVSGATVTVTLKSVPVDVSIEGTAITATTTVGAYVPYDPSVVEGVESVSLEPEGSKRVERKAVGTIVIYNNFSSAPQRLIKNTRFETTNGLIFRIPESIIVPGKIVSGGKTLPGSIETSVYADRVGTEYNIGLSDFTVPGFKSSAERYAGFYARSKVAMSGGFVGVAPFVSPEKVSASRATLRKALEAKLAAEVVEKIPADSIMLAGGYAFKATSEAEQETADKKVSVTERGTLTAFVFKRDALASYIARRALLRYDNAPVEFSKLEGLSFEFLSKADFGKNPDGRVLFGLRGTGTIVWKLDEERLKQDLAGKLKSETVSVLASYPAIERSQVVIRPFWKKAFPDNIKKISVVVKVQEKASP